MAPSRINDDQLLRPEVRRAIHVAVGLVVGFIVVSAFTVVATHRLPETSALMTPAARLRSIICLAAGVILLVIALQMASGSRKAFLYVRIEAIALLVSVVVLVLIPGVLPPWMIIEQVACGALLLGVTFIVNGRTLGSIFRRLPGAKLGQQAHHATTSRSSETGVTP